MRWSGRRGFELPVRPRSQRLLLGVCAGIAARFGIDVTLVRLAFLLLSFAWGLGILLYLALWVLTPTEGSLPVHNVRGVMRRNVLGVRLEAARSRRRLQGAWMQERPGASWPRPLGRRWLGITLLTGGLAILLWSLGALSWVTPLRALGLAVIALGIGTLVSLDKVQKG